MTPLDLSRHAPHAPGEELEGIAFLPRAVDKARASLPGGNLGAYFNELANATTLSAMFYAALRLGHDDFVRCVESASAETEVADWVRAAAGDERIAAWNQRLKAIRLHHMTPDQRTTFNAVYGADAAALPPDTRLIDAIAEDDRRSFAAGSRSWDDRDSNSDALSSGKF